MTGPAGGIVSRGNASRGKVLKDNVARGCIAGAVVVGRVIAEAFAIGGDIAGQGTGAGIRS